MPAALLFAVQVLQLVGPALQGVTGAIEALQNGKAVVDKMVGENRDPTPDEWAALNAVTASLADALQSDDK